jgi:hypothetical protein
MRFHICKYDLTTQVPAQAPKVAAEKKPEESEVTPASISVSMP